MQTYIWNRIKFFKNKSALEAFILLAIGFVAILIASLFVFSIYLDYSRIHLNRENFSFSFVRAVAMSRALPEDHIKKEVKLLQQRGFSLLIAKQSAAGSKIITNESVKDLTKMAEDSYPNLFASVQLNGGKWLIINSRVQEHPWFWSGMLISAAVLFLALISLCLFVVNNLAMPSQQFIEAAQRFGVDVQSPPLPLTGPAEIQRVIRAFNEMQNQIRRLLTDRTQMLAAISHDLRTPITRLQLRLESVKDTPQYEKMMSDLAEMEQMINSILSFARDYIRAEPVELLDLNALIETLCNNMIDAGHDVQFQGLESRLPYYGRLTALKRALGNLIENAIKYGNSAEVVLQKKADIIQITISDHGPGIPLHEIENVFAPFYRVDKSRNKQRGSGLGLAVARDIIRAHGGDITLLNRQPEGLIVMVILKGVNIIPSPLAGEG